MPEERITLGFKEQKLVWNRWVKYEDYNLMDSEAYITAGNEFAWMSYLEEKYFTPDFFIMMTSFDLTSISLLIRYGTDAPKRWSCSGAPLWKCSEDVNGMFPDEASCKSACKGDPVCIPDMKCETPLNGHESDGCGLRRANTKCDPVVSVPLSLKTDKTTIKVGDLLTVSGTYRSGAKVIIYEDVLFGKVFVTVTCNSAGNYSAVVYLKKPIGIYNIRAKSDALILPDLSSIVKITVIAGDVPCISKWRCKEPKDGSETDGCGNTAYNSLCLPEDPKLPCADGNTRIVQCPNNSSKTYAEKCVLGKWTPIDKSTKCDISDNVLYYILLAVVVILVIMVLTRKR